MGVSKNRGTPQIIHLIGFSIINDPFWGHPYFWKHPYIYTHTHMSIPQKSALPPQIKNPIKSSHVGASVSNDVVAIQVEDLATPERDDMKDLLTGAGFI